MVCALLLTGCAPPSVPLWYRPGKPHVASLEQDLSCQIEAAQKVPASNQVRSTPSVTTPSYVSCNSSTTSCTVYNGQTIGGQTYTVDVNDGLRRQVIRQCMAKKGWQLVTLPNCSATHYSAYLDDPEKYRAPKRVTAESCAVLDQSRNEWVIFTPT